MKFVDNIILKIRPAFLSSIIKKFLFYKRKIHKTKFGIFFLDRGSVFGNDIICKGYYELEMIKTLKNILTLGDIFIDLGANEGYFSIIASNLVGVNGKIFCIEPQSRLQNVIYKNIELNNARNVYLSKIGISDKNGSTDFYLSPDINTGSSGFYAIQKYKLAKEKIKVSTLSNYFKENKLNKIKLLKIDVEGYECEVILSSKEIFKNQLIENIALELHPKILSKRGKNIDEISNFLESCGYCINKEYTTLVYSLNL